VYPGITCNPFAAYSRAYAHVSGKCASYHEFVLQTEMTGAQNFVSTLMPNSFGEAVEVRDPPSACIAWGNDHAD
jgi:hypothetical protein